MTVLRVGDWQRAHATLAKLSGPFLDGILEQAVIQEAEFYRGKIRAGIRSQAPAGKRFAPLAQSTLDSRREAGKRSTKALIYDGDLINAITVKQTGKHEAFIGILRTARSRDGKKLANIAAVHENGTTIVQKVTERQRRFLNARNFRRGYGQTNLKVGDTLVIRIPARPFVAPIVEKYGATGRARFLRRVATLARGALGPPGGAWGD